MTFSCDAKSIDVYTLGQLFFMLFCNIYPCNEAKTDDFFYKIIASGNIQAFIQIHPAFAGRILTP
jgi:hypothetical protein